MTIQNRVDPWGCLRAVNARGSLLGNRGMLHNDQQQIVRDWQRKPWVTCALEFQGRKREVFGRTTYSELFFLDEATAFAAGHRPCASCRRERYDEFKASWLTANDKRFSVSNPSISEIDKVLHGERIDPNGAKVTFLAPLSSLPLGTVVDINREAFLVWHQGLKRWSFAGYSDLQMQPALSTLVRVLTPESVVRTFSDGFLPVVHSSANG
ncbi:MAG: hypothetical protein Q7L55_09150 [Actinomycetota bacterium]|nr:hypothetical protein [Actinomycetota bacterium]